MPNARTPEEWDHVIWQAVLEEASHTHSSEIRWMFGVSEKAATAIQQRGPRFPWNLGVVDHDALKRWFRRYRERQNLDPDKVALPPDFKPAYVPLSAEQVAERQAGRVNSEAERHAAVRRALDDAERAIHAARAAMDAAINARAGDSSLLHDEEQLLRKEDGHRDRPPGRPEAQR